MRERVPIVAQADRIEPLSAADAAAAESAGDGTYAAAAMRLLGIGAGGGGDALAPVDGDHAVSSAAWPDHYAVLGVPCDFVADELKRAFRTASLRAHPDKKGGSEAAFQRAVAAHAALADGAARRAYDAGEVCGGGGGRCVVRWWRVRGSLPAPGTTRNHRVCRARAARQRAQGHAARAARVLAARGSRSSRRFSLT